MWSSASPLIADTFKQWLSLIGLDKTYVKYPLRFTDVLPIAARTIVHNKLERNSARIGLLGCVQIISWGAANWHDKLKVSETLQAHILAEFCLTLIV